ncbi:MAG: DUF5671 domain-containing protein [Betaproteobacteria bacterium]|nr:DUF5671 domain-containing protein [Betaproteobacteria bacterium]
MKPLADYVQGRIQAGIPKSQIKEELHAVGWSEDEADAAYRNALVALGIPVPGAADRQNLAQKSSPMDVAVNVFAFILLGIVVYSLAHLYFAVIDKVYPDPLGPGFDIDDQRIRHAIASLLIAFPGYVVAMRFWFRRFAAGEGRSESRLTRWLTYVVLLLASVTMVSDLITVLYHLLQGEVTPRFMLKAVTILALSGLVFSFYYLERRRIQYRKAVGRSAFHGLGGLVGGLVLMGIVLGFLQAGSPERARARAFDLQRSARLQALSGCIERYAREMGQLPGSLAAVRTSGDFVYCANSMQDPATHRDFEYRVVTGLRNQGQARVGAYELCATFDLPSARASDEGGSVGNRVLWYEHPAGRGCHTVTAHLGGRKSGSSG